MLSFDFPRGWLGGKQPLLMLGSNGTNYSIAQSQEPKREKPNVYVPTVLRASTVLIGHWVSECIKLLF